MVSVGRKQREYIDEVNKKATQDEKHNKRMREELERYIAFNKEVDRTIKLSKGNELTRDNVLEVGNYTYKDISIMVEESLITGFKIINDRKLNLFMILIEEYNSGDKVYKSVCDLINNLFNKGV